MSADESAIDRIRELGGRIGRAGLTKRGVTGAIALSVVVLTLVPLVILLWTSVWTGYPGEFAATFTLDNVVAVYLRGAYDVVGLFSHSLFIAVGMTLVAGSFGLLFAWLLVRTNLPTKGAMELVLISPYAVPGYIYALMYITTYGAENGLVATGVRELVGTFPIDLFSPWGIAFVAGIDAVTTFYLLAVPALQSMDASLEEVSRVHGASLTETLRSITLPLILPAIVSGVVITILRGLGSFAIVEIFGVRHDYDVYATAIRDAIQEVSPPRYGEAAALALSLLLATAVLVWYYRRVTSRREDFMTVTSRGSQPNRWDLGEWRWPVAGVLWLVLGTVWLLPIGVMFLVSLHATWHGMPEPAQLSVVHYLQAATSERLVRAFANSVVVALTGATLGTVLVMGLAYYTERTTYRFRRLVDVLSLSPLAIPGIIMGTSVLFTFLWVGKIHPLVNLYGTLWIIVVGSIVVFIPFASRIAVGNIVQIHSDLEESARIFGASWIQQLREVFLPLSTKTTAIIWFYLLIHIFQLLTIPIMTYTPGTQVIPVEIFNMYYQRANLEYVSAVSMIFIGLTTVLLLVFRYFGVTFYELDAQ